MRADPAGWPYQDPDDDDPGWTGGDGDPGWTSGGDGWPPRGATPGWPYGEDHPSWPAGSDYHDWPRGGGSLPSGREPPAMHYDGHRSPEPAAWVPAGDRPDESQQWSGQQAAAPGEAAAYYDVAAGHGRARVLPPSDNQDWPQIMANSPAELLDPFRRDTWGLPGEDSVRLTQRILSDADTQAASVRREAMEQAGAIREAAEREAEDIRRQAA